VVAPARDTARARARLQFLAAIQAGDLDGAVSLGEAILRAEPSNMTVRKAMPMICLRRDQLSLLRQAGDDDDDDNDDDGAPAGAESDESDDSDESDVSEDDEEDDTDDEEEEEEEEAEAEAEAEADAPQRSAQATRGDKPVISALRKLLADE
jgi:TATA-binding protein-associated factor Taf7